jgi:hypothetical protein
VRERATAKYTATLQDENGTVIPLADLTTLKLTLYDKQTDEIINSRDEQGVLNENDVTFHATSGLLTWTMKPADNVIIGSAPREEHIALFEWTYAAGAKAGHHAASIIVRAAHRVP